MNAERWSMTDDFPLLKFGFCKVTVMIAEKRRHYHCSQSGVAAGNVMIQPRICW
jgi:hypothetical protein